MNKTQNIYHKNLVSLFRNIGDAKTAYNAALKLGYKKEDVALFMSKETKANQVCGEVINKVHIESETTRSAGVGGALGVTLGALIGSIIALSTNLFISELNFTNSTIICVWLASALAGGLSGGFVGVMINIGIRTNHDKNFKNELKEGVIIANLQITSLKDYKKLKTKWYKCNGIILYPTLNIKKLLL